MPATSRKGLRIAYVYSPAAVRAVDPRSGRVVRTLPTSRRQRSEPFGPFEEAPRLESARPWWAAETGGEGVGVLMSVAVVRGRVDEIVLRRDPVLTGPDGNGTGQPM